MIADRMPVEEDTAIGAGDESRSIEHVQLNDARSSMLSGLEEGFEADAEILVVLEAVEQGELVEADGAEGEALGADEAAGGDCPAPS
jgi:hypothetical protein